MGERIDCSPQFRVTVPRFCGSQDRSLDSWLCHIHVRNREMWTHACSFPSSSLTSLLLLRSCCLGNGVTHCGQGLSATPNVTQTLPHRPTQRRQTLTETFFPHDSILRLVDNQGKHHKSSGQEKKFTLSKKYKMILNSRNRNRDVKRRRKEIRVKSTSKYKVKHGAYGYNLTIEGWGRRIVPILL